jgi:molybdopterin molybdotransferase
MAPLSVLEARDRILEKIRPLAIERVALAEALGRVLAERLTAPRDQPPWDSSAMDGFAARAADLVSASAESPARLAVVEEIPAGKLPAREIRSGEAARIMTGAPLPRGADTIVRIEDTEPAGVGGRVGIRVAAESGRDVRRAGEDLRAGATVLEPGQLIGAAEIGLIATIGRSFVDVPLRPVVAILATGDELVEPSERLEPQHIVNSNGHALAAMVREAGGIPRNLGIARDDRDDLRRKLGRALGADAIVTSAGVSVGDHDHVKEVLEELGTSMTFWKVAMKPGHPLAFGQLGERPVFGLPGNPVSSMVSFELFVRPALLRMAHHRRVFRRVFGAVLDEDVKTAAGRTNFVRGVVTERDDRAHARTTGPQGSGISRSMSLANALLVVPAERAGMKAGETVAAMYLGCGGLASETRPF